MLRIVRWGLLAGVLSVSLTGMLAGEEIDELRTKAKLLQKEADVQAKSGNSEGAEKLKRISLELRKQADLLEQAQHDTGPKIKLERAAQRLRHLREAAENLKLAEAHDLAHEVMKQADAQEQQVAEIKRDLAAQHERKHPEHPSPQVEELRSEVERLRAEVRELRQAIEKRP